MDLVFTYLSRALGDLFRPRVLTVLFLPMLAALALWGLLFWLFGNAWIDGLAIWVAGVPLPDWLGAAVAAWLLASGVFFLLVLLLLPAIYVTALLLAALVFMPLLVNEVAQSRFPHLARRRGGSFAGSLGNALVAISGYLLAWLLTLPFWLFLPLGAAIGLVLNAWLNKKLFLYDALADHADAEELARLGREAGAPLYGMALLLGLLHLVPVLNFLAPVYMGLAFAHYGLDQLNRIRNP